MPHSRLSGTGRAAAPMGWSSIPVPLMGFVTTSK